MVLQPIDCFAGTVCKTATFLHHRQHVPLEHLAGRTKYSDETRSIGTHRAMMHKQNTRQNKLAASANHKFFQGAVLVMAAFAAILCNLQISASYIKIKGAKVNFPFFSYNLFRLY
jgi:hypothetical protein